MLAAKARMLLFSVSAGAERDDRQAWQGARVAAGVEGGRRKAIGSIQIDETYFAIIAQAQSLRGRAAR